MQQDYNNEPFFVRLSLRWGGFVTTGRRDPDEQESGPDYRVNAGARLSTDAEELSGAKRSRY
jgi:hypothetical protein